MSIIYVCDGCGRRGIYYSYNEFKYLCHIDDIVKKGSADYIDNNNNGISGRVIKKDLCNSCYNIVLVAAVKALKGIEPYEDITNV